MSPVQRTLLAIALFLALALGSFVWFIARWDASKAQPIGLKNNPIPFISPDKLRGLGQSPRPALSMRTTA